MAAAPAAAAPAAKAPQADPIALMGALMPFARNSEIYGENEPAEEYARAIQSLTAVAAFCATTAGW